MVLRLFIYAASAACSVAAPLKTVQTAYHDLKPDLLKDFPDVDMVQVGSAPTANALVVDRSIKYQEMVGFGGAFTEAASTNWLNMSDDDRAKIIKLYFADPVDGGHGYTLGRVPMGSCDFTASSYNFDNRSGDYDLEFFDNTVAHDEANGILPMIRAAQEEVQKRGQKLNIVASPWSPPAWMKYPVPGPHNSGETEFSMLGSAKPVGLDPRYADTWSKYFSKFISAYKNKGVELWGVTPQNEPEFAAGWEACVYTPESEATFVREHLGPTLHKDHPGLKIIGFDHNKDHVVDWAKVLYADDATKQYFDGIGVHWYGGLNTGHLNTTHHMAPDKFLLATEACNCGGVVFQSDTYNWWSRAEKLAIDILEDIKWYSVGWTDWNLILDTKGGPNHLGNLCDANILCDPKNTVSNDTIIMQASYYFMGHFSRFIPAGSRQVGLKNSIVVNKNVTQSDLLGKKLQFVDCSDDVGQTWHYDASKKTLGLYGLCAQATADDKVVSLESCSDEEKGQQWTVNGGKIVSDLNGKCLSSEQTGGSVIGLDPGVDVDGGLVDTCQNGTGPDAATTFQNFTFVDANGKRFPDSFHLKTSRGTCMIPAGLSNVMFDAVAFETPKGDITLVAMNLGNNSLNFDVHDVNSSTTAKNVVLPPHAIATYSWGASSLATPHTGPFV